MITALRILAVTFLVLFALNYFSIRFFKLQQDARKKFRKIALIIYGVLMTLCGIAMLIVDENLLLGWFYILLGISFPIVNWIEYRKKNL